MSNVNLYEYIQGEFQDLTRAPLSAAGAEDTWIIDVNGVKIAGYNIALWDGDAGGVQLQEGSDYSLVFLDADKTASEGVNIWAGYIVHTPAYQSIPLYLDMRIIGGYTKYASGRIIEEYELGGQYVTKWDTGRIEISMKDLGETATVVNVFAEALITLTSAQAVANTGSPRFISLVADTTSITTYGWTNAGAADATARRWTITGTWK